jgi:hypothetical protein
MGGQMVVRDKYPIIEFRGKEKELLHCPMLIWNIQESAISSESSMLVISLAKRE